jgi:hypothetical protein
MEKNRMLYTLLQHGVETTVDRRHKTHRIINWIKQVSKTALVLAISVGSRSRKEPYHFGAAQAVPT